MKKNKYYVPPKEKSMIKYELYMYKTYKKTLKRLLNLKKQPTREIEVITLKIGLIDQALKRLSKEDREAAQIIFFEDCTVGAAEMRGMSKGAYYNAIDRICYITAQEFDLV